MESLCWGRLVLTPSPFVRSPLCRINDRSFSPLCPSVICCAIPGEHSRDFCEHHILGITDRDRRVCGAALGVYYQVQATHLIVCYTHPCLEHMEASSPLVLLGNWSSAPKQPLLLSCSCLYSTPLCLTCHLTDPSGPIIACFLLSLRPDPHPLKTRYLPGHSQRFA